MAILNKTQKDYVKPSLKALTPLSMYLERVKSVSENLRISSAGLDYIPLHFGGVQGQQQSLVAKSVIRIVDFKLSGNN